MKPVILKKEKSWKYFDKEYLLKAPKKQLLGEEWKQLKWLIIEVSN